MMTTTVAAVVAVTADGSAIRAATPRPRANAGRSVAGRVTTRTMTVIIAARVRAMTRTTTTVAAAANTAAGSAIRAAMPRPRAAAGRSVAARATRTTTIATIAARVRATMRTTTTVAAAAIMAAGSEIRAAMPKPRAAAGGNAADHGRGGSEGNTAFGPGGREPRDKLAMTVRSRPTQPAP